MRASVILCHHKGELLRDALSTLCTSANIEFSIMVVTSVYLNDPFITKLRHEFPWIHFLHCEGGPAKKRNYAAKLAHSEFLVFFDDDVEVEPDTLKKLIEANSEDRVGMVFGKLYNAEFRTKLDEAGGFLTWSGFIWSRAESNLEDVGQFSKREPIFAGKSAACSIKTQLFKAIGGFDETFGILGEESDLAWRVWLAGEMVMFEPASVTYHKFNTRFKPRDFYTNERVYFNGCRNYITMLMKNLEWKNLWIVPFHTLVWIGAAFGMIVTGKFQAGLNILKGLGYVLGHLQPIGKKRRAIQSRRVLGDSALFSLILRQPKFTYYWERFSRYIRLGLHG